VAHSIFANESFGISKTALKVPFTGSKGISCQGDIYFPSFS